MILLFGITLGVFIIVLLLSQTYLSHTLYPNLPVNLCFLSFGSTFDEDVFTNNKKDCFDERATSRKEWQSCFFGYNHGNCLAYVSLKTRTFLCEKTQDKKEKKDCYNFVFYEDDDSVHSLQGIEKYKSYGSVSGKIGERLTISLISGNRYLITVLGTMGDRVDIGGNAPRGYCSKKETPPIRVVGMAGGP